MLVVPADVGGDGGVLLGVGAVVGAVERELAQGGEFGRLCPTNDPNLSSKLIKMLSSAPIVMFSRLPGGFRAELRALGRWHAREADPWPWLGYFTEVIADAYSVFAGRAAAAKAPGTKQARIRAHILRHAPATFRLAEVRTAVPGVSDQTIRIVLEQLKGEGKVRSDGTGRGATWTRLMNTAAPE